MIQLAGAISIIRTYLNGRDGTVRPVRQRQYLPGRLVRTEDLEEALGPDEDLDLFGTRTLDMIHSAVAVLLSNEDDFLVHQQGNGQRRLVHVEVTDRLEALRRVQRCLLYTSPSPRD